MLLLSSLFPEDPGPLQIRLALASPFGGLVAYDILGAAVMLSRESPVPAGAAGCALVPGYLAITICCVIRLEASVACVIGVLLVTLTAGLVGYLFETRCLNHSVPIVATLFGVTLCAVFAVTTLVWPSDWRDLFSTIAYPVAWKQLRTTARNMQL
jgi:hypothetical protein